MILSKNYFLIFSNSPFAKQENYLNFHTIFFQMGLFLKECLFYGEIMPLLEKERKVKKLGSLAIPKCFYTHSDPGVLVMKNLKDEGFDLRKNQPKSMSKISQDDANILFMKSLASLHASTHHLIEQTGKEILGLCWSQ